MEESGSGGGPVTIQYLLRAVRIGVLLTLLVIVALVVFPVLPGHRPLDVWPYTGIVIAAAVGAVVVTRLPWGRLFEAGLAQRALSAWSAFDIALVTLGIVFTGKGGSELWCLYALTTVFFAAACPPRAQVVLFAGTIAAYVGTIAATGLHATAAVLFLRTSVLALVAMLASFLSGELVREMNAAARARRESERAQRLLLRLLSRLVNAQEEERVRVGRELHDELGQLLTSILHFSRRLEHDLTGEDAERVSRIVAAADRALTGIRSLVRGLRPVELDHLGLVSAVRRLAYDLEDRHALHIAVRTTGMEERVPPDVETAAYRVVQEALTNVVLHSGATDVEIELSRRGNELYVAVQDDGGGFDPVAVSRAGEAGGVGLIGMLERARLVEGEVRIESAPGRGTLVRMRAPVVRGATPETPAAPAAPAAGSASSGIA